MKETPYEKVARLMTFLVKEFDEDGNIPCFIFGDKRTRDFSVAPLVFEAKHPFIVGMDNVIKAYRENVPKIQLFGPTTLAPMINEAIKMCKVTQEFHILVVVTDGEMSNQDLDAKAIVEVSNYPLSIVAVGVGDGPFGAMETFDSALKKRKFDNFNFVNLNYTFPKLIKYKKH
jgi:hypothetical protein